MDSPVSPIGTVQPTLAGPTPTAPQLHLHQHREIHEQNSEMNVDFTENNMQQTFINVDSHVDASQNP